jgi:hypothetical protein
VNLYLITRTDRHDYDEYDAILVRASDPVAALGMLARELDSWTHKGHACRNYCTEEYSGFRADGSNAKVEEVPLDGPPALIVGSFNAG